MTPPPLKENKLLVVAAHPDDEVLGCGGTVRQLTNKGWTAHLLIMTGGVGGRHSSASSDENAAHIKDEQTILANETANAANILGFSEVSNCDFPDNRMDLVSRADISIAIREKIDTYRPTVVFTHHPGDYNWDHSLTFDGVMMAARCNPPEFSPQEIRTFEVLSSTERAWQDPSRIFQPNLFVDISCTITSKQSALEAYKSEYREYPHPRSVEAIEILARKRGNEVGLEFAEAFHLVRKVEF